MDPAPPDIPTESDEAFLARLRSIHCDAMIAGAKAYSLPHVARFLGILPAPLRNLAYMRISPESLPLELRKSGYAYNRFGIRYREPHGQPNRRPYMEYEGVSALRRYLRANPELYETMRAPPVPVYGLPERHDPRGNFLPRTPSGRARRLPLPKPSLE